MPLLAAWLWLLLILFPLVFLERWMHRHLQGVWLLIFRHEEIALAVYSLIMLPGVVVHEGSHWLAATFLGVRTGRFSLIPERMPNGTLRLGYVETDKVDVVREALIGIAPLVAGAALIIFIGHALLGVGPVGAALARGDLLETLVTLQAMLRARDVWIWLYFIFTVSNSMLPSASDRRAWLPLGLGLGLLLLVLAYAGFGNLLMNALLGPLDTALRALAFAFTLTVVINLCLAPFIWLLEQFLIRLTGLRVQY